VVFASSLAVLALLVAATAGRGQRASGDPRKASYDLFASYPNTRRAAEYFLSGLNRYGSSPSPSHEHQTSLWFVPLAGGAFEQFSTAPFRNCHRDVLRWGPGKGGVLVYLSSYADCYSDHTTIVFRPGITYMPKIWTPGERWTDQGVSGTVYSENGVAVCIGTNTWRSRVVGLATISNTEAVHTQTNETQLLSPIAGAPESAACPVGRMTTFAWQENFYLGARLPVRGQDGSVSGTDVGLLRSTGGSIAAARQAGHPEWDVVFSSWGRLPSAEVGTFTTTTTSIRSGTTQNTITFTYTAPSDGVKDASLTIAVPAGWTPPVTTEAAGCTTASAGAVTTNGQTITVTGLTLDPLEQAWIVYGATTGGSCNAADGATAPSTMGAPVWQAQVALHPGHAFTDLASAPAIYVTP
jgi:hypothetical protein